MHGLIFVTKITYWQDQPCKGASTRSRACRWRAAQRWQQDPRGEKEGRRTPGRWPASTTASTADHLLSDHEGHSAPLYSTVEGRGSAPRRGPSPCCPGAGSGHQAVTWRPADACSRLRGQGARPEARPPPPGAVRTRGQFTKAGRDPPALAKARQGGERRGTPWLSTHQHRRTGSDDVPQIWAEAGPGSERHRGVARGSTGRRDKADGRRDC